MCIPKLNQSPQTKVASKVSLTEINNHSNRLNNFDKSCFTPQISKMKKVHLKEENFSKFTQSTEQSFKNLYYFNRISNPIVFFKVASKNFSINFVETNKKISNPLMVGGAYEVLIKNSSIFSDKSLFIKEIYESGERVILICMPRRCGKSTNLEMLNLFLSKEYDSKGILITQKEGPNYKLFIERHNSLDISKEKFKILENEKVEELEASEVCCSQPVIYLDFQECYDSDYKELKRLTRENIIDLYEDHDYLEKDKNVSRKYKKQLKKLSRSSKESILIKSVYKLSKLLFKKYGQKVWILIDEYDAPINNLLMDSYDKNGVSKSFSLFRRIYKKLLKNNKYLKKAVLTGILYLSQNGFFSGLNNVRRYTIDDYKFAQYYCINEEELQKFLAYFRVDPKNYPKIKEWYNGYKLIKNQKTRELEDKYNIWSIVNYLLDQNSELKQYWMDTKLFDFITPILAKEEFKKIIDDLTNLKSIACHDRIIQFGIKEFEILNEILKSNDVTKIDQDGIHLVVSYLYCLGYLTNSDEKDHYKIPNLEIRKTFIEIMKRHYEK